MFSPLSIQTSMTRRFSSIDRAKRYTCIINNKKKMQIGITLLILMVVAICLVFSIVLPEAKCQDKKSPTETGLSHASSTIINGVILVLASLILLIHIATEDSNVKNTYMSLAVTLLLLGLLMYIALDQAPKRREADKSACTTTMAIISTIEIIVVGALLALSFGLLTWKM